MIVRDLADPDRMRRLGVEGLRRFVARRGVVLRRAKADQLIDAAKVALRLPVAERLPIAALLAADVALLEALDDEIRRADQASPRSSTRPRPACSSRCPASASSEPAPMAPRIGDPWRFPNAGAAYRASGLVPAEYSSAGRRRGGQHISREGSVELRSAIIELGRGLAGHDHDFAAYRRRLRSSGKRPAVAAVAVGHRAHRLAFAMLRIPGALRPEPMGRRSGGRARHGEDRRPAHQNDVTRPPALTMDRRHPPNNPLAARRARRRGPGTTSLQLCSPTSGLRR